MILFLNFIEPSYIYCISKSLTCFSLVTATNEIPIYSFAQAGLLRILEAYVVVSAEISPASHSSAREMEVVWSSLAHWASSCFTSPLVTHSSACLFTIAESNSHVA